MSDAKPKPRYARLRPRRLYDHYTFGRDYMESDRDFMDNNREAILAWLEKNAPKRRRVRL